MSYLSHDKQVVVDGQFVSEKVSQIVGAIRDYCPELEVQWIPPSERDEDTAAFRVVHFPLGKEPYIVCFVTKEEDFDERLLQRLIAGDQRNGKVSYSDVEAAEKARRMVKRQKYLDALEEAHDIAAHVLRSPLNTYKVNDDLIIKDGIPGNQAKRRK